MTSMKGHRRKQLMTGRKTSGHNRGMFMAYSPKMDADLIILGDLEFIHWATELETNPSVVAYRFDEDVDVSVDEDDADNFIKLRGIWVESRDGAVALHQINPNEKLDADRKSIRILYRLNDHVVRQAQLVSITYAYLSLVAYQLDFWLKVIAMASQVRSYVLENEIELVGTHVQLMKEGTIRSLLEGVDIPDQALALGAICRLIITGSIQVEVGKDGFGYNTVWSRHD